MAELIQAGQDRRMHVVAAKFSSEVENFSQSEKKQLLSHLFTSEWMDKDSALHFQDKDGKPIRRFVQLLNKLLNAFI
jgi:hypothetical protein